MTTVAIIQARLGSSRLPRKVLADLAGKPLIDHVIERALAIEGVDSVVVNVPKTDLHEFRQQSQHKQLFWGVENQEQDVLGSYALIAREMGAETVVRLTGDCPLLAPELVAQAIRTFKRHAPTSANYLPLCMPYEPVADGWDAEVFSNALLQVAARYADLSQREHVTTWMREPGNAILLKVPAGRDYTRLKCSVDTVADLDRARTILAWIYDEQDYHHLTTWGAWHRAGCP